MAAEAEAVDDDVVMSSDSHWLANTVVARVWQSTAVATAGTLGSDVERKQGRWDRSTWPHNVHDIDPHERTLAVGRSAARVLWVPTPVLGRRG